MKNIALSPIKSSLPLFERLEQRGLIRTLAPTKKTLSTRTLTGAVDAFYTSAAPYGSHTLLCIGKRSTSVKLCSHPDNEEFILLNNTGLRYKPLYLIIALDKRPAFVKKLRAGTLCADDLVAVELAFNDPRTCVFCMLKDTVHCEITLPGPGQHPVFFVSEPSRLKSHKLTSKRYAFGIKRNKKQ